MRCNCPREACAARQALVQRHLDGGRAQRANSPRFSGPKALLLGEGIWLELR